MRAPARGTGLWRQRTDVQRLRHRCLPQAACWLLAASLASAAGGAAAQQVQTAPTFPDPLAPKLEGNPRQPPRFEKVNPPESKLEPLQSVFTPPASGAGLTGFDSTNARNKTEPKKPKRGLATNAPAPTPRATLASGTPALVPASRYQVPQLTPSGEGNTALAQAPGTPPVEDIGPIRKPPKKRKAFGEPEDPFAPLGIRVGAFDLYPAVELIGGYDTNPGQANSPKGAALYSVAPELRVQSDWSRHELKADLRGNYTGYSPDQTPSLSRPYFNGKVDGRVDVTRQTRIELEGRGLISTDNPSSPNLQAGLAELPLYATFGGTAGIGHRFNRFDLSIKGSAERTVYQESHLTDGSTVSNEDRNYDQYGGTLRGDYEVSLGVTPFVEIGAHTRVHDLETDSSGYQRNSTGLTGVVGTNFELSRLLTGEIAVGYTKRNYEDPRLEPVDGFVGDASLVWTASALTTVKLTAASTVGESTITGVSGVLYRDVALQVDHAFRRWLIGSLKGGFGIDDYVGSTRVDHRYSLGAALTHKLGRDLWLKGEFRQHWLQSDIAGNGYSESVFLLGLRLQR